MLILRCEGGPAHGAEVPCRYPEGLVVVNRDEDQVAVYDAGGGVLNYRHTVATDAGLLEDIADGTAGARYDVLAYDASRMEAWS